MIVFIVTYRLKPGTREKVLEALQEKNIEARFRAQRGNICFRFGIPPMEEDRLYLTDVWETKEDFLAHRDCEVTPDWTAIKNAWFEGVEALRYQAGELDGL